MNDVQRLREWPLWKRAIQRWRLGHRSVSVGIVVDRDKLQRALNRQWSNLLHQKPVDGQRIVTSDDRIIYLEEQTAYRLKALQLEKSLTEQALQLFVSTTLGNQGVSMELPLERIVPEITLEHLKKTRNRA